MKRDHSGSVRKNQVVDPSRFVAEKQLFLRRLYFNVLEKHARHLASNQITEEPAMQQGKRSAPSGAQFIP